MDPRTAEAVDRVARQKVPDELTRALHDADARFHDVRGRLDALTAGDREQGHQARVDALSDELREAAAAVDRANQAIQDHMSRPVDGG